MAYVGGIFFANMGGGGGQNYFHKHLAQAYIGQGYTEQIRRKCSKNAENIFQGASDDFGTFFRIFFDIFAWLCFSGLSNGLPATNLAL